MLPGANLDGKSIYNVLERHHVTDAAGVPTVFMGLLQHMQQQGLNSFSTLRRAITGGAACSLSQIQQLDALGVETRHAWGERAAFVRTRLGNGLGQQPELCGARGAAVRCSRLGMPCLHCLWQGSGFDCELL